MNNLPKNINKRIFDIFEEISSIPRESGNEKAISSYLLNFGKNLGLECIKDSADNVIIKKSASEGYEKAPVVIIQGHMDMVCEKNRDKVHDFTKDPIELVVKGNYIYADKTTLGADDGIALAYGLALLEDNTLKHPKLEMLFTTNEEGDMSGARSVKEQYLDGEILINIDSEEEGKFLVSSAGGVQTKSVLKLKKEKTDDKKDKYTIVIRGLKGGHSGKDIHLGRINANKLMGRFLNELLKELDFSLISVSGGTKTTAIPRECTAVIEINPKDEKKLLNIKQKIYEKYVNEYGKKDGNLRIHLIETEENYTEKLTKETEEKIIKLLYLYPDGVVTFNSEKQEDGVESSTNLGIVKTYDDYIEFLSTTRSSVKSLKYAIVEKIKTLAEISGGSTEVYGEYPEWKYNIHSKIRKLFKDVYKDMYGENPEIISFHAGLECGIFEEKLKREIDMISFGPDIIDIHTPNEHIDIKSADRCYKFLTKVLEKIV